jgi:hypothetical protein
VKRGPLVGLFLLSSTAAEELTIEVAGLKALLEESAASMVRLNHKGRDAPSCATGRSEIESLVGHNVWLLLLLLCC